MRSIGGSGELRWPVRRLQRGALLAFALWATAVPCLVAQSIPLVIRGLSFKGNKAVDATTLEAAIATTNSGAFARWKAVRWIGLGEKRTFNQQDFLRDILRIKVVYRRSGYLDVAVDTVVVRDADDIYITFEITEGPPVVVDHMEVIGVDSVPDVERKEVLRDLPLAKGDVFSRYVLEQTRDTVLTRLRDRGYPNAQVIGRFGVNDTARIARVTLEARPGTRAVFGTTRVTGQQQVDSSYIASLLTSHPGQEYRQEELYRSQRAMYAAEVFRFASVQIDSANFTDTTTRVPLIVNVAEGEMHRAMGSAGFATTDCFVAGAGWRARNAFGGGKILDLSANLSKIGVGDPLDFGLGNSLCKQVGEDTVGSSQLNYGVALSVRRNAFLSPDNSLLVALFGARRSEYKVYLREEIGVSAALSRETAARVPVTLTYRLAYGATEANAVNFCAFFNACVPADIAQLQQRDFLGTLSLSAIRRRVNNFLDPSRGSVFSGEVTVSSKLLGSSADQQFARIVGDASFYLPLTRGIVLASHLRLGYIYAPTINLASGATDASVPPDQRFYAGGPNDVRGYDRNELGPVVYVVSDTSISPDGVPDPNAVQVSATGGNHTAVANLELRLPSPFLSRRLRFAAFVDAGSLWEDDGRAVVRITPGFGMRFASPLGPMRFDIGYNWYQLQEGVLYSANSVTGELVAIQPAYVKDRGRNYTIHFSVGQAF